MGDGLHLTDDCYWCGNTIQHFERDDGWWHIDTWDTACPYPHPHVATSTTVMRLQDSVDLFDHMIRAADGGR